MRFLWSKRFSLSARSFAAVLNYSREKRIKIKTYKKADDIIGVSVSHSGWLLLRAQFSFLQEMGEGQDSGVLPFLAGHKNRVGLLVGGIMALLLFCFLGGRVWDVRISGNTYLSDAQIAQELARVGLGEGQLLSELDTKAVARDAQLASQSLSFVGINVRGTVAYVHVIERKAQAGESGSREGGNLIASSDAVIDSLAVRRGEIAVKRGQVVKKGDLLVSGITEGSGGSQITQAEGEVFARVSRRFEIVLPRLSTVQQEKQRQTVGLSLVFWGKNINIYTNAGNLPPTYDTIYEEERLYIGDGVRLPFGLCRTVAVSCANESLPLSDEELVFLAQRRLAAELALALKEGELLCKKTYGSFTEDSYVLVCEVECLENIAELVEFDAR